MNLPKAPRAKHFLTTAIALSVDICKGNGYVS
jgi:hypothetical protein